MSFKIDVYKDPFKNEKVDYMSLLPKGFLKKKIYIKINDDMIFFDFNEVKKIARYIIDFQFYYPIVRKVCLSN